MLFKKKKYAYLGIAFLKQPCAFFVAYYALKSEPFI